MCFLTHCISQIFCSVFLRFSKAYLSDSLTCISQIPYGVFLRSGKLTGGIAGGIGLLLDAGLSLPQTPACLLLSVLTSTCLLCFTDFNLILGIF